MQTKFYKPYAPRFTVGELWRASNNNPLLFAILLFMKLFRIGTTAQNGIGLTTDLIATDQLSDEVNEKLSPLIEECRKLGFTDGHLTKENSLGNRRSFTVVMLSPDRFSAALISNTVAWEGTVRTEFTITYFVSELSNGTILLTTNFRQMFNLQHPVEKITVKAKDLETVYRQHCHGSASRSGVPRTISELRGFVLRTFDKTHQGLIDRRVLVPLSDDEVRLVEKLEPKFRPALTTEQSASNVSASVNTPITVNTPIAETIDRSDPGLRSASLGTPLTSTSSHDENNYRETDFDSETETDDSMHPEDVQVLRKIHVQLHHTTNWVTKIALLVISLAAFVGLGAFAWNWELLLLIIPILFFHELGHYVAMRWLKYKNVKMFFLPLLGAAVHGRSFNAPGWQRAVVALAGPIPGIVAACVIGWVMHGDPFWMKVVLLTLFLNALNLLPFLPLDGGWVVQSTLFSRNMYFDFAFRVFATCTLLAAGVFLGDRILMFLGAFMTIGLPMAWKICGTTTRLKKEGWIPNPETKEELCAPTTHEIVKRVRTETKTPVNHRANTAIQIYELLSARPPGFFATIALLAVQAAAFFGSIVFAWWMITGGLNFNAFNFEPPEATIPISSQQIKVAQTPAAFTADETSSMCLTCADEQSAAIAALQLAQVNGTYTSRFGNSLIVEFSGDPDPEMIDIGRQFDSLAFRGEPDSAVAMELAFTIDDPDAAKKVRADLEHYLQVSHYNAIPPWSRSVEMTDQHRLARKTWNDIMTLEDDVLDSPEIDQLYEQLERKAWTNDSQGIARISQQIQTILAEARQKQIEVYRARSDVDDVVCELCLNEPQLNPADDPDDEFDEDAQKAFHNQHTVWTEKLKQRLGCLEMPDIERFELSDESVFDGHVYEDVDRTINFSGVSFQRIAVGSEALIGWLEDNGATNIHYSMYNRLESMGWNGFDE